MRLTVGPLPAAVYWRRRAVVLVGLAMIVLVIMYACGGPDLGSRPPGQSAPTGPGRSTDLTSSTPAATQTQEASPAPTASAYTLPVPGTTGACTDNEMEVTATAAAAEVLRDHPLDVTIKIKNVAARTCNRDIGANMQELRLLDDRVTIWSSDDCGPNQGTDDRSFEPGQEVTFTLTWTGRSSRGGDGTVVCDAPAPEARDYQLVARLDQKLSAPFAIRIRAQA
jgi:hypothetical protein